MKKLGMLLAIAFAFVVPHTASAITSQVLMGGNNQVYISSNSATRFTSLFSNTTVAWANSGTSGTAGTREIISAAGTIKNFTIRAGRPLNAGSYTATVMKNAAATVITCTITSPATSCSDPDSLYLTIGDQIELRVQGSGGPTLVPFTTALDFVPDVANEMLLSTMINNSLTAFAYDSFVNRNSFVAATTLEATTTQSLIPISGVISGFRLSATTAPGGATSQTYSLRVNQATTSVACTFSGTTKACTDNDYAVVSPNSWVNFSAAPSGAIVASGVMGIGFKFVPTVIGQFFFMGGSGATNQGTTGTVYEAISGGMATSSREDAQMVANEMTITGFTVGQTNTTGTNITRTYTLEVNGSPTTATCSTTGTSATTGRTCSWQGSITVNAGDLLNYVQTVTGGTATNSIARISTIAYRAPSAFQNKIMGGFMRIMGGFIRIK